MSESRQRQLAYSELQPLMHDRASRVAKAAKMAAIIEHFLGRDDLVGLRLLDVGSSTGVIAGELARRGARVVGADIDEPGLRLAAHDADGAAAFVRADSEQLPIQTESVDVVVCNHVYEHVVSPERLFAELRRVVAADGILYLALGNRLGVIEPHHRLPFLSWLPPHLADRYVRVTGRGDRYHERFRTRPGLRDLCRGLHVWDYSLSVLAEPERFAAGDVAGGWKARIPTALLPAAVPLLPTYLWVASTSPRAPAGPPLSVPPRPVPVRREASPG